MAFLHIAMMTLALITSSCVTTASINEAWQERKSREDFKKERAVFVERMGGKEICWTSGVSAFAWASRTPSKDCLYPASAFSADKYSDFKLHRFYKKLKVIRASPDGFLVNSSGTSCHKSYQNCSNGMVSPDVVFIHKSDQQDVVDGSYLDTRNDLSLYEYRGPFTYESVLGPKTVHSFKKIPEDSVPKAVDGLTTYRLMLDLYAATGAWEELDAELQRP